MFVRVCVCVWGGGAIHFGQNNIHGEIITWAMAWVVGAVSSALEHQRSCCHPANYADVVLTNVANFTTAVQQNQCYITCMN